MSLRPPPPVQPPSRRPPSPTAMCTSERRSRNPPARHLKPSSHALLFSLLIGAAACAADGNATAGLPFRWGHVAIPVDSSSTASNTNTTAAVLSESILVIGGTDNLVGGGLNATFALPTLPTLSLNISTSLVTVLSISGSFPPTIGHACAYMPSERSVYCAGGYDSTSPSFSPRSRRGWWRFSLDDSTWTGLVVNGFLSQSNFTVLDLGIADTTLIAVNSTLLMVGGRTSCYTCTPTGVAAGTVHGTIPGLTTTLSVLHEPASGLFGHCMVKSRAGAVYVLFGRTTAAGTTNSTAVVRRITIGPTNSTVVTAQAQATGPSPRLFAACAQGTDDTVEVFGGVDPNTQTALSDCWTLSLTTLAWTQVNSTGNPPPARSRGAAAILEDGRLVVQGGIRSDGMLDASVYAVDANGIGDWSLLAVPTVTSSTSASSAATATSSPTLAASGIAEAATVGLRPSLDRWITIGLPIILALITASILALSFLVWRMRNRRANKAGPGGETGTSVSASRPLYPNTASTSALYGTPTPPRRRSSLGAPPSPPSPYFFSAAGHEPVPPLAKQNSFPSDDDATLTRQRTGASSNSMPRSTPYEFADGTQRFSAGSSSSPPIIPPMDFEEFLPPPRSLAAAAAPPPPPPPPLATATQSPPPSRPTTHPVDLSKPYTARYTHTPRRTDELGCRPGDTLTVRKIFRDGWAVGMNVTKATQGFFPASVLEVSGWDSRESVTEPVPDAQDRRSWSRPVDGSGSGSGSGSDGEGERGTLAGPPPDTLRDLEELDWALEEGVLEIAVYFGQRKRLFMVGSDA
ncbi:hypothetical protein HKX48_005632 [Thoreauomyces humboldtii]|nr:hypothetical protein HKX48_005632 [Thoreauomyces humboldtii]